MRPTVATAGQRLPNIVQALARAYPEARCTLQFTNPLELLVATVLSAQCTDALVNKVTADLFQRYRTAADYAKASLAQLTHDISRVNFYRTKAAAIQRTCQLLVDRFHGQVPDRMDDLLQLPGVARKTANVILGNAFGRQEGIVVDTHVMRLSQRLGLSAQRDRDKIERDLMRLVPKPEWTRFSHRLIAHGRALCTAKAPKCSACPLDATLCPSYEPTEKSASPMTKSQAPTNIKRSNTKHHMPSSK